MMSAMKQPRILATAILFTCVAAAMLTIAAPCAMAQDADTPVKNATVPFREDSGLITAEYYIATGKYTQSIQVLGGVLTRHPQNADAYCYRGVAYQQLGDLQKARENFKKALLLNPSHLGALKYMGDLYLQDGKLDDAMQQMLAIRAVCGSDDCEELIELQSSINKIKAAR